jgi:cobalt-zinc-cadmium efflux system outer membrane protein
MLQIAEAREASGDAAALDVTLARIALRDLRNGQIADSLAMLDALAELQSLLGMPQDRVRLVPTDALDDLPVPVAGPGFVPARIRAADSLVVAGENMLLLARRSRIPAPLLRFGFEVGDPSGSEAGLLPTVGLSIPLPVFDRGRARVQEGTAALERATAERTALARAAEGALEAARRRWDAALRLLAEDEGTVEDAEQIAMQTREAYREGAYPLVSVMEAQRTARDVLRRRIEHLVAGREAAATYRYAAMAGGTAP